MLQNRKGFTLIELLIVVVIIGILAAIAIPRFGATRDRAYISQMKSDLRNLQTSQELYYSSNSFNYSSDLEKLTDFTESQGVNVTINNADQAGWQATANHDAKPKDGDGENATDIECFIYVGAASAPSDAPDGLPAGVVGCTGESFDEEG